MVTEATRDHQEKARRYCVSRNTLSEWGYTPSASNGVKLAALEKRAGWLDEKIAGLMAQCAEIDVDIKKLKAVQS